MSHGRTLFYYKMKILPKYAKVVSENMRKLQIKENVHSFRRVNAVNIIQLPSEKGSTVKGKNVLPFGGKFFPLE